MSSEFVHLHAHTQYSMLDGACRLSQSVEEAAKLGMRALAITDHGNMHGAVQHYKACKSAGVLPIIGCEVNLTADAKAQGGASFHLVLLASSQGGYENLVRIVSRGWVEGSYRGQPRIDLDILQDHREGVVGLSGCLGGFVSQEILQKGIAAGRKAIGDLVDVFTPGHFFLELQDHGFPEQRPLNEILVELGDSMGIRTVASNDCHYIHRGEGRAQLALQCIGARRTLSEMEAVHHGSEEIYLKSAAEMAEVFGSVPESLRNTMLIAEMCGGAAKPDALSDASAGGESNPAAESASSGLFAEQSPETKPEQEVLTLAHSNPPTPLADPKLPNFPVPEGQTEDDFLRELSKAGLETRMESMRARGESPDPDVYFPRLDLELDIICGMGFPGYFLIVQDFIRWAKAQGIPVGPGRGSGAGSLVAYSLDITNLDPITHGLLFERFLNPERVSMPDFDIDFCMARREEVIQYVRDKYGEQSVGQIATFHLLKSRSVVRDVGRVLGMTPGDAGRIATLIPEPVQGKTVSIAKALEVEPRLKARYDEEPEVRELIDTAQTLEDLTRHAGMHAAGVVISEGPLWDHVPVFCPDDGIYVTQYDKDDVEKAGLVKFDFLGLKTLTVIDIAVALIDRRPDREGEKFDIDGIPMDDPATFHLLQSGETTNVFQLESQGMQSFFQSLKPDEFEDIVAAVALYRPGPMGADMHQDFIERKHGRAKVTYPDPCLAEILQPTRGVIVYQEQVMKIAQEMGGYSLGGADLLRRAMGKKKKSEMDKQRAIFIEGAMGRGHTQEKAEEVFDLMAYFAGYGFNKSHSAAYALLTYQTAYLKAHFPVEFVCATLSADKEKSEKVVRTVAEARSMGITVLPPDITDSSIDFTVVYEPVDPAKVKRNKKRPVCMKGRVRDAQGPRIRFGLGAIKGVGSSALETVLQVRSDPEGDGAYKDLYDFASRVDMKKVNRGVVEALVQSGAFDGPHSAIGVTRAQAFAAIDGALERGKREQQERESGQTSLLGLLGNAPPKEGGKKSRAERIFPRVQPWDGRELLEREKSALGFYVSGHPLDRYAKALRRIGAASTESLATLRPNTKVTLGGMVEEFRERTTRTGRRFAFFNLEDSTGRVEVIVRTKELEIEGVRELLSAGDPVMINGLLQFERDRRDTSDDATAQPKIKLDGVHLLAEALRKKTTRVLLSIALGPKQPERISSLKDILAEFPGRVPVSLQLSSPKWSVSFPTVGVNVEPSERLRAKIEALIGEGGCEFR